MRTQRALLFTGAIIGSILALSVVIQQSREHDRAIARMVAYESTGPIYTAQEAISRTLEIFPGNLVPVSPVAKLIKKADFHNIGRNVPIPYTDPSMQRPVWVVAVYAAGATTADLGIEHPDEAVGVPGFYYQWNANSGDLEIFGGLDPDPNYLSWTNINALVSQSLGITPAAPRPTHDLATSGPPPTDIPIP